MPLQNERLTRKPLNEHINAFRAKKLRRKYLQYKLHDATNYYERLKIYISIGIFQSASMAAENVEREDKISHNESPNDKS